MSSQIRKVREELKLSTSEVALKLGISQSSVVRLEQSEAKGTISLNTLEKVLRVLGCELEVKVVMPKRKVTKKYHGLQRTSRTVSNMSRIGDEMKEQEFKLDRSLSPEERVLRSLALSDFARSLR